jgi:hypothetical protein
MLALLYACNKQALNLWYKITKKINKELENYISKLKWLGCTDPAKDAQFLKGLRENNQKMCEKIEEMNSMPLKETLRWMYES